MDENTCNEDSMISRCKCKATYKYYFNWEYPSYDVTGVCTKKFNGIACRDAASDKRDDSYPGDRRKCFH